MKNKTLTIILSAILIICISLNIYQYIAASKLQESLSVLTNTKNELTSDIENKTTELNKLTSEIEAANTTISELTAKVESLTSSINDTQLEIDTLQQELADDEETGDNISESDREIFDEIWAELEEEYPDLFVVPSSEATGNTTKSPGYVSVDAPVDTGELPTYNFGEGGDSGVAPGTVY